MHVPTAETRPKRHCAHLWVCVTYHDGDTLRGTMPIDLLLISPDALCVKIWPCEQHKWGASTIDFYIPRAFIKTVEVLGVVNAHQVRAQKPKAARED